jgi:hypothetical protein
LVFDGLSVGADAQVERGALRLRHVLTPLLVAGVMPQAGRIAENRTPATERLLLHCNSLAVDRLLLGPDATVRVVVASLIAMTANGLPSRLWLKHYRPQCKRSIRGIPARDRSMMQD